MLDGNDIKGVDPPNAIHISSRQTASVGSLRTKEMLWTAMTSRVLTGRAWHSIALSLSQYNASCCKTDESVIAGAVDRVEPPEVPAT